MQHEYNEEKLDRAKSIVKTPEHMLGKGLNQPYNNTNSGPRKNMFSTHSEHCLPIFNGTKATTTTGYEIRFGDLSSSVIMADTDYQVVGKISKHSFAPNNIYYLILRDLKQNRLEMVTRIPYFYVTESYGYLYNNTYLDSLQVGSYINNGQIVRKSIAYDEFNNRRDGRNARILYQSLDQNMEDSVIVSESFARLLESPLVKPVKLSINENDIPLDLYGNNGIYKCMPDIGEDTKNSLLIALRKEKKEEILFSESVDKLKKDMMSDQKKQVSGTVIDIDIMCNNVSNLDQHYNAQFKMYYLESLRVAQEFLRVVTPFVTEGYKLDYALDEKFENSKRVLNQDQFKEKRSDKRAFSNIKIDIAVLTRQPLKPGDKISNRYGGKGVVSKVVPDDQMPMVDGKRVDIIFNQGTVNNRENMGQLLEVSVNEVSEQIVDKMKSGIWSMEECFANILKFRDLVSKPLADFTRETISKMDINQQRFFLDSIISDGIIDTSVRPVSESMDIFKLREIYRAFPWVEQKTMIVAMKNSKGQIRKVEARRKVSVGTEYIYRLKQFAEEKFSATSLSSTNIKGLNTKSKASKNFNDMYSNTPIRFGNMEQNVLLHAGPDEVVKTLMLYSVSPEARLEAEELYTCDPYHVNLKLRRYAANRAAEIVHTFLKVLGRKLVHKRIKKARGSMSTSALIFDHDVSPQDALIFHEDMTPEEMKREWEEADALREKIKNDPNVIEPFEWDGIDYRLLQREVEEEELRRKQMACKTARELVALDEEEKRKKGIYVKH